MFTIIQLYQYNGVWQFSIVEYIQRLVLCFVGRGLSILSSGYPRSHLLQVFTFPRSFEWEFPSKNKFSCNKTFKSLWNCLSDKHHTRVANVTKEPQSEALDYRQQVIALFLVKIRSKNKKPRGYSRLWMNRDNICATHAHAPEETSWEHIIAQGFPWAVVQRLITKRWKIKVRLSPGIVTVAQFVAVDAECLRFCCWLDPFTQYRPRNSRGWIPTECWHTWKANSHMSLGFTVFGQPRMIIWLEMLTFNVLH